MTMEFWGSPQYGAAQLTRSIEVNIVEYLKWGFLQTGAYKNVSHSDAAIPSSGTSMALLKPIVEKGVASRTIYEGRRTNWLWESGLNQPTQPTVPAIYKNGSLVSTGYYIDYNNGRVVFTTPLLTSDVVTASYGYRLVQVYDTMTDWVRELDINSMKMDDSRNATASGSGGDLEVSAGRRAQLPLITVRPLFNYKGKPYENGSSTMEVTEDFILSAYAQTPWEMQLLHDILVSCDGKYLPNFNINTADPTFNYDGSKATLAKNFPTLCSTYPGKAMWNVGTRSGNFISNGSLQSVDIFWTIRTIN